MKDKKKKGKNRHQDEDKVPNQPKKKGSHQKAKRGRRQEAVKEWKDHFAAFNTELSQKGLYIRDIDGDGNCLFRSFSDQLDGCEIRHFDYRLQAVEYMRAHEAQFKPYVDEDETTWEDYLKNMSKDGEWGDHMELQALSQALHINIIIHMKGAAPFCLFNFPRRTRTIHLSYHMGELFGEHYSSVRKRGDDDRAPAKVIDLDELFGADVIEKLAGKLDAVKLNDDDDNTNASEENNEDEEQKVPEKITKKAKKKAKLEKQVDIDDDSINKNSKCPCGSGKKFKNCCIFKKKKEKPPKEEEDDDAPKAPLKPAIFI